MTDKHAQERNPGIEPTETVSVLERELDSLKVSIPQEYEYGIMFARNHEDGFISRIYLSYGDDAYNTMKRKEFELISEIHESFLLDKGLEKHKHSTIEETEKCLGDIANNWDQFYPDIIKSEFDVTRAVSEQSTLYGVIETNINGPCVVALHTDHSTISKEFLERQSQVRHDDSEYTQYLLRAIELVN